MIGNNLGGGQITPREMGTLMKMIVDKEIINTPISERMLRLMGRQYWDEEAISQIPPDVFVADKKGAVDESRQRDYVRKRDASLYLIHLY